MSFHVWDGLYLYEICLRQFTSHDVFVYTLSIVVDLAFNVRIHICSELPSSPPSKMERWWVRREEWALGV